MLKKKPLISLIYLIPTAKQFLMCAGWISLLLMLSLSPYQTQADPTFAEAQTEAVALDGAATVTVNSGGGHDYVVSYGDDAVANDGTANLTTEANLAGEPPFVQTAKLNGFDQNPALDKFGEAIAISGNMLAVGVRYDDQQASNAGAVYLFQRNSQNPGQWRQVKKLFAPETARYFGQAVAISGNTLVVGAPGTEHGAAYVFQRDAYDPDRWNPIATLVGSDGTKNKEFGSSVAISGDTLVVGDYKAVVSASWEYTEYGAAYIFQRHWGGVDNWGQVKKLVSADLAAWDDFGRSVAISGDMVVVGTPRDDHSGISDPGSAYVFYRNRGGSNQWGQQAKLIAKYAGVRDYLGKSVAISGSTVVVGVPGRGTYDRGAAHVFSRNQGGPDRWGQVAMRTAADGVDFDQFGTSVSISGNRLIVGLDTGKHVGAAYVFERDRGGANQWGQLAKLKPVDVNTTSKIHFGKSVSISGGTVAVGAPNDDVTATDTGSVYVFKGAAASDSPDFVVTSVTLSPSSPPANGTFSATVTMKNQGTASGDGRFLDVWAHQPASQSCGADGKYKTVGTLAAGASASFTFTGLSAGTAGSKTFRAFVDSQCQTAESNESNNQYTKTYTVGN